MLEGTPSFLAGRKWRTASAGETVVAPAGVRHAYRNRGRGDGPHRVPRPSSLHAPGVPRGDDGPRPRRQVHPPRLPAEELRRAAPGRGHGPPAPRYGRPPVPADAAASGPAADLPGSRPAERAPRGADGPTVKATQDQKAADFRALHEGEAFVIPNPWDAGSARVLEALGFKALATTSSGFALALGRLDGDVTLDEVVEHTRAARRSERPSGLRRPRERLRPGPGGRRAGDHQGGRGGSGRRLDRGLRPGRRDLRLRPRRRARDRGLRGGPGAGLPVHAHGASREPHPRQPGPRRHDLAPAGVRARRRGRALRARTGRRRPDPSRVRRHLKAGERARPRGPVDERDRRTPGRGG